MHRMMPATDASLADPSHTAIPTPDTMMNSDTNSLRVGVFFSMKTEPTAATTGMLALWGEEGRE